MPRPRARFYIFDRMKNRDADLANFRSHFHERYAIVDRQTGEIIDEALTQYEARQAVALAKAQAQE